MSPDEKAAPAPSLTNVSDSAPSLTNVSEGAPAGAGPRAPTRIVHAVDAIPWLEAQGVMAGASFIASLPDVSELSPLTLAEWKAWFVDASRRVLRACPDDGVAFFYQTDIVERGVWVDKAHLVMCAADELGVPLLMHRIVCRKPAGLKLFGRPAYTHLLCFSRQIRADPALPRADVLPGTGEMTWARAMGVAACVEACRFIRAHTASTTIVDPFCGQGSALAVANAMGFDAIGVELSRKRAQRARNLRLAVGDP